MRPTNLMPTKPAMPEFNIFDCAYAPGGVAAAKAGSNVTTAFSNVAWDLNSPLTSLSIGVPSSILVDGTIEPGTADFYSIDLVAGETYLFSVFGSGGDPLTDTILAIFDPGDVEIAFDDDGGAGTSSLITITAAVTGTYTVGVAGFSAAASGDYTLDAVQRAPTDVIPDTFEDAVPLTLNAVTYGFVDSTDPFVYAFAGETDTYAITVEAGKFYTIEVAGGADYASDWFDLPDGELDPYIFLYGPTGSLITSNDDISFPDDISSRISFLATTSGTYYLDVQSYYPWLGGYSITAQEVDLSTLNPLDAIDWKSSDTIDVGAGGIVKVYFGLPGETFGEPGVSYGWNAFEKQQVLLALNSEYGKILGYTYVETTNVAEAEFRLFTTTSTQFGAYFYPQDPAYGSQQGIGAFNVNSGGWDKPGASTQDIPGNQVSLLQGGFSWGVILHEFGHAHGLAHPHDNGGGSDIMAGVGAPTGSYGVFDLNQGVYTVMSYNDAWDTGPNGATPFTQAHVDSGWSGTLGAFDIAQLQAKYGINNPYNTGNTVYQLKDVDDVGAYYETIWDTGGTDEIRYTGNRVVRIDLLAATIDYTPTGGGVVSYATGVFGGYTIAKGVVIENGTGGNGNDGILGNSAANTLKGNGGNDVLVGREGADKLDGGAGTDTASYIDAKAGVAASLASGKGTAGDANGDTFTSIEKLEGSAFADTLGGGNANDTLTGLAGNDTLSGFNGDDVLDGGAGDDTLDGGNHADTLNGGDGNDALDGGNHNDTLNGGAGNDNLSGGNQDDVLNGGAGNDILVGGNHNDTFRFTETGGTDQVADFRRGQDKIDLSGIDAVNGGADNAFSFIGAAAFTGVAGQLRSFSSAGSFFVTGDTNGDAVADFTIQTNLLVIQADLVL